MEATVDELAVVFITLLMFSLLLEVEALEEFARRGIIGILLRCVIVCSARVTLGPGADLKGWNPLEPQAGLHWWLVWLVFFALRGSSCQRLSVLLL